MAAPATVEPQAAQPDTLSGNLWRALAGNPHRFVLISFGLAIALLLLILWRGLVLAQNREVESLRQMQAARVESIDALLRMEEERLLSIRNYAEHLLQIERTTPAPPDTDLKSAFAHRNDDVWSLTSHDAAAVYGVSPTILQDIDGFARRDAKLFSALRVMRSLSHLLSAAPHGAGIRRHVAYVSTHGLLVSFPSVPEGDVDRVLHHYASSPYFQRSLPVRGATRHTQWAIADSTFEVGEISLFLAVPVYAGNDFEGVAILEIPRRSLDDYLSRAPYQDIPSYLADRSGALLGASPRNVRRGETLESALSGSWPPATLARIFDADTGMLGDGNGRQLITRRLGFGGLAMFDEVQTRDLLLNSAARLSGMVGAGAAALGILLCLTLAVVHTLFRHYMARGETLRTMAETDALTGLENRRAFAARFAAESARCARDMQPLAVIMLDIDYFKKINDRWGHASGDVVLRAVADALRNNVRKDDLPARLGGEEFAILLSHAGLGDAASVAEKLRQVIADIDCEPAADAADKERIRLTVSLGVAAIAQAENASLDALLMAADRRLYRAKSEGRNRVVAS